MEERPRENEGQRLNAGKENGGKGPEEKGTMLENTDFFLFVGIIVFFY
tara:strand:- start:557 stop:700 length:144 start_codon:yes stop_codon:yes gene_type:complete